MEKIKYLVMMAAVMAAGCAPTKYKNYDSMKDSQENFHKDSSACKLTYPLSQYRDCMGAKGWYVYK
jgi:hypothetical protein